METKGERRERQQRRRRFGMRAQRRAELRPPKLNRPNVIVTYKGEKL